MSPTETEIDQMYIIEQDRVAKELAPYIPIAITICDGETTGPCLHCGEECTVEQGEEMLHHHCWMQQVNADDLADAFKSCIRDLAEKLEEYEWERRYRASGKAPEKDGIALRQRINAVLRAAR